MSTAVTPQEKNRCPHETEYERGRDHAASVEEPYRNRLYWDVYRHAEGSDRFADGFCDYFRNI